MKSLLLISFTALIFTVQANAQVPPMQGECLVIPSKVLTVIPPPDAGASFYSRLAIGKMNLENNTENGLRNSCKNLGGFASRNSIMSLRKKLALVLIVNNKIIELGKL